jgi:hypothetical protein
MTRIRKCRNCKSQEWERRENIVVVSRLDDKQVWLKDGTIQIKVWYQCSVCQTSMFTSPVEDISESVEPQLTIEERGGDK